MNMTSSDFKNGAKNLNTWLKKPPQIKSMCAEA